MANGDIPMRSSGLADIQSILDMVAGKSSTTSTSENVSPEKSLAFIQAMLGGTAGLAAVSGAQKSSGLYGSSTNKLLTNDLLARTAAQTAALSTNKSSTTRAVPQVGSGIAGAISTALAANSAYAKLTAKKATDAVGTVDQTSIGAPDDGQAGTLDASTDQTGFESTPDLGIADATTAGTDAALGSAAADIAGESIAGAGVGAGVGSAAVGEALAGGAAEAAGGFELADLAALFFV